MIDAESSPTIVHRVREEMVDSDGMPED